jgi:hypothetical protein
MPNGEEVPLQWDLLTKARDFNRRAFVYFGRLPRCARNDTFP